MFNVAVEKGSSDPVITATDETGRATVPPGEKEGKGRPLFERVKTFHERHKDRPVTIRAAAGVPFGAVAPVMMACAIAEVPALSVVVGDEKPVAVELPPGLREDQPPPPDFAPVTEIDLWMAPYALSRGKSATD